MAHFSAPALRLSRFGFTLGLLAAAPLLGACGSDVSVDGQGGGPAMGTGGAAQGPATGAGGAPLCDYLSVKEAVSKASPCFGGMLGFDPSWAKLYPGYGTMLSLCPSSNPATVQAEWAITKPAADAVEGCTNEMPMTLGGPVTDQAREMWSAIYAACPDADLIPHPPFKITIDANGKVASVAADPVSPGSLSPALIDCMMMALTSHTFACLSNFEICPGDGGDP